ncbi:ATP-binding cassette domain-containing protein [Paenibacillus larvae]|nr:ATP-binding cassette domain-containing protein [Paenibacillus larvae]MDT2242303.1 ATP-binding cassette domain-containing protein [Paenibacillus larvae]MDT2248090.1 ATP-binding cassette domain-containing protein [Paenibacillus larvae]MDT2259906.1 ATP-binding cassette domain-containing protein [Paenibacillus larvae]MDT2275428.1 ATP-binding cassette domain-containing protein [Paenibacillus larvae]MDT2288482.1 ATP-binding cassette domain-containing protein [Paenibacillus larvae]
MNSLNIYLDHFAFGKQPIFVKQEVSVTKGNIVGIIGENGIGKSTFVNLLAGNITSTLQINYHNKSLVPGYNPFVFSSRMTSQGLNI